MQERLQCATWGDLQIQSNIIRTLPEIPMPETVCFAGYNAEAGKRSTAVQASVYDAMMADWIDERNAEKEKVRIRRKEARKHPENKETRKKNKMNRMHSLYGHVCEFKHGGKDMLLWENKREGRKVVPEKDAKVIAHVRDTSRENGLVADYNAEFYPKDMHVGSPTLSQIINRMWAELYKMSTDFCEQNGYVWGEENAYDHGRFVRYPVSYYKLYGDYETLRRIQKIAYDRKCYMNSHQETCHDWVEKEKEQLLKRYVVARACDNSGDKRLKCLDDLDIGAEFALCPFPAEPQYEVYKKVSYDIWSGKYYCKSRANVGRNFDTFCPVYVI